MLLSLRRLLFCGTLALAAPLGAAEHPLALDPAHSRIDVAVKASFHSFNAHLGVYSTALAVDDAGRISTARVDFNFRDLATGKPARDQAMHEWQQTDRFPDGSFVLSALEPRGPGAFNAVGKLILHGTTRELSFPVSVSHDGAVYAIDGDAPIDTREHGLPIIRMFGMLKVEPVVHVRFHLQARKPE